MLNTYVDGLTPYVDDQVEPKKKRQNTTVSGLACPFENLVFRGMW